YCPGVTNRNLVLWRTQTCASAVPANDPCLTQGGCSNKYDCWEGDSSAIATTTTTEATSTGEILDADIELNDPAFSFTTADGPPCAPAGTRVGCLAYHVQHSITAQARRTVRPPARAGAIARARPRSRRTERPQPRADLAATPPRAPPGRCRTAGPRCTAWPRSFDRGSGD